MGMMKTRGFWMKSRVLATVGWLALLTTACASSQVADEADGMSLDRREKSCTSALRERDVWCRQVSQDRTVRSRDPRGSFNCLDARSRIDRFCY